MPAKVIIMDGAKGTGQYAGVTPIGELLLAGFGNLNNKSSFRTMASTDAFNFYGPITGQQFVITSILIGGTGGAVVTIYEASSPSTLTIDKTIFQINLRVNSTIMIPFPFGGFLPVSEGEYLNATTTATVNINIVGYYSPIKPI
jgi:hypothetical protein